MNRDRVFGASDNLYQPTNQVGHCSVCGIQWVITFPGADDQRCPWCGASAAYGAIQIEDESPDYGGAVIQGPR